MTRSKQLVLGVCWLVSSLLATATSARELVIAFDNTLQPSSALDAKARSQMLVRNLANVLAPQAMFLINTYGLDDKDAERLAIYGNGGHLLVNAGHQPLLLNRPDLYAFEVSILKAGKILESYPGYKKHVYFPYLYERGNKTLQQGLIGFLTERHYRPAVVGLDMLKGADAYMNARYQARVLSNRRVDIVKLEQAYVEYVLQTLAREDALAFGLLGYSPRQVLVLQENDLTAYFIAALIEALYKSGWTLVAAEDAFNDPVINPILGRGFSANHFINTISGLSDVPAPRLRVLDDSRQSAVDKFLQARVPELMQ